MAGAILIGEGTGVSMGTAAFYDIVELIRLEAQPPDADLFAKIYHNLDVGLLPSIGAWKLDAEGFNIFAHAVMRSYVKGRDSQPRYRKIWEEILSKITADPRYRPVQEGS